MFIMQYHKSELFHLWEKIHFQIWYFIFLPKMKSDYSAVFSFLCECVSFDL